LIKVEYASLEKKLSQNQNKELTKKSRKKRLKKKPLFELRLEEYRDREGEI
jgi:hypothetical protein